MPGKTSNTDFKYRTNQTEAARPELQRFTVMLYCFQGHIIVFFPRETREAVVGNIFTGLSFWQDTLGLES